MNMAVHGLTGVIKSGDGANTFYNDAHNLVGKCDYVMANPPFNVDMVKSANCDGDPRLTLGLPAINKKKEFGNANYLWISYFYSYLNDSGRAGFVMASSATDSQGQDKDIREKLVKTGHVDVMISVGNNFFYTKSLPCSLWFFDKAKGDALKDKVLFIDARNYFTAVDRTLNEWSEWQLKNLNAIVWLHRGEKDKYTKLLTEYHKALNSDKDFATELENLQEKEKNLRAEAKKVVEAAKKAEKSAKAKKVKYTGKKAKEIQAEYDEKLAELAESITVAQEANWLYEKFGDGEYADVLGLCKSATISDIEAKGWSLTPGAYVGVAPVEDDGVDFGERMKEIHQELISLQAESNELMEKIQNNLKELGI